LTLPSQHNRVRYDNSITRKKINCLFNLARLIAEPANCRFVDISQQLC